MKSVLCEMLGIEYPIIQGAMAWVADADLARAVSNAGGLGLIGTGHDPVDVVNHKIADMKTKTDNPFGVNIMLLNKHLEEVVDAVCASGVKVVTTGAGSPGKYMEKFKAAGIKVIPVVASVALARRMEKDGADAVIVEGMEAGGHIGKATTMALVPQVVSAVNIPVIAAGGIGDGRGMAAAFMLGAKGVQMGTHFVVAKESVVHQNYKDSIIKAKDIDTKVTGRSTGHPVRGLRNAMTKEYLRKEAEGASAEELELFAAGGLRKVTVNIKAVVEGDVKMGSLMAGQSAGLVTEELTCKELLEKVVSEAKELLGEAADSFL